MDENLKLVVIGFKRKGSISSYHFRLTTLLRIFVYLTTHTQWYRRYINIWLIIVKNDAKSQLQGYDAVYWHSANDIESEGGFPFFSELKPISLYR